MDLARCGCRSVVPAVQGEANTRVLEVALYDNGIAWEPKDGTTAAVAFQKPDGTKGLYDKLPNGDAATVITGSTVTATLAPQVLTCAGVVTASIVFYDADQDALATFPFTIKVEKNPAAGEQISYDYYNPSIFDMDAAVKALELRVEDLEKGNTGGGNSGGTGGTGADGFSPIANVTQTDSGAVVTITDKSGTTTATIVNGKDGADGKDGAQGIQGEQGPKGDTGSQGPKGDKGDTGPQGIPGTAAQVRINPQTQMWEYANEYDAQGNPIWITSDIKASGEKGDPGDQGIQGIQGPKGDTGAQGEPGQAGADGKDGSDGKDGVSATHSWNGTTLTITSASGTSSANLKGEKGDKGDQGIQGVQGEQGPKGDTGADGKDGSSGKDGTSVTVKSVSESTADGGSNVVTFSDGKTLTIKNGSKGSTGSNGTNGTNGVSVSSVTQTTTSSADGGSNVVTVTLSNGTTSTFTVKNGSKGSTGGKGDKGDKGDTGATGAAGANGKSAYAYAQDGGYTGTETQFASDLSNTSKKVDSTYLIPVFEELKTAIQESNIDNAVAILDRAILDLSKLS
jgi:hypothetical protein